MLHHMLILITIANVALRARRNCLSNSRTSNQKMIIRILAVSPKHRSIQMLCGAKGYYLFSCLLDIDLSWVCVCMSMRMGR